jgi:mannose-6-phosphate isomerase-like protein (cupin superfamily)
VTAPGAGEAALSGPISLRILEDGSATGHRLGMAEIVIAPHTEGPPQHRHREHDEGFYVVSGTVRFTSGDTSFEAPARTLVMVPPGAPHSFANAGDETAIVLNTFTPDLYIGYFRELRDQIAAGRELNPELIGETMRHYATE